MFGEDLWNSFFDVSCNNSLKGIFHKFHVRLSWTLPSTGQHVTTVAIKCSSKFSESFVHKDVIDRRAMQQKHRRNAFEVRNKFIKLINESHHQLKEENILCWGVTARSQSPSNDNISADYQV